MQPRAAPKAARARAPSPSTTPRERQSVPGCSSHRGDPLNALLPLGLTASETDADAAETSVQPAVHLATFLWVSICFCRRSLAHLAAAERTAAWACSHVCGCGQPHA